MSHSINLGNTSSLLAFFHKKCGIFGNIFSKFGIIWTFWTGRPESFPLADATHLDYEDATPNPLRVRPPPPRPPTPKMARRPRLPPRPLDPYGPVTAVAGAGLTGRPPEAEAAAIRRSRRRWRRWTSYSRRTTEDRRPQTIRVRKHFWDTLSLHGLGAHFLPFLSFSTRLLMLWEDILTTHRKKSGLHLTFSKILAIWFKKSTNLYIFHGMLILWKYFWLFQCIGGDLITMNNSEP